MENNQAVAAISPDHAQEGAEENPKPHTKFIWFSSPPLKKPDCYENVSVRVWDVGQPPLLMCKGVSFAAAWDLPFLSLSGKHY